MDLDTTSSSAALDGFLVLARASQGQACVMVIKQVLKHPQIFVFGELLSSPNIKEVWLVRSLVRFAFALATAQLLYFSLAHLLLLMDGSLTFS